jgi:hypothetical protein
VIPVTLETQNNNLIEYTNMNVAIDNANMIGKTIVIAIPPLMVNFFIFDFLFYWFVDFVELLNQIFND